ncbi:hypothetical protein AWC29_11430 [Mycobacterium triplex]|uniref:ATP-binding protein n=2 Tax=Mycobacterium simiae complex TaxID=2249310 RepID=A0A0E4H2C2_MYCLN|nr:MULTISPECIES: ATP-binding protein [Mycobacterium simiae complex]ORX05441.1 hypothetical protein AWC29_11430 [Mycobacterium triplex]ULP45532.1 ATP-binding protein [Mycobacterium lentiflavum]CDO91639.1 hypothetical protein BN973_06048 [Mycobacterium triplex]CQD24747.1 hypothetical protein BN1232_06358 [Mycobacterium lentiflavum]
MNKNNNTQITVFYGDQPAHAHERRAINVVRNELARRNMPATLLVNFAVARGARQIDLLIVSDQRCMNVELKHVDPTLPLIATPNGPWRQRLPEGAERMVADHGYYEQALQETYGVADVLADLNRKGVVPGPTGKGFARHIDTVVCCDPHIPAGSTLNRHAYVSVVGLDTLVDRLAQPGPGLPHWDRRHWDEVIRHLGLYPEGEDTTEALRRRADAAAVEDYRRRFREFTAANLPPLVAAAALIDSAPVTVNADTMADHLVGRQHRIQLAAESGQGKTHLAKHAALTLTDRGQMVVWIDADDYRKGHLIQSLRRAVSPFSTHEAHSLLAKAAEGGSGITFVIDALEKCPHREKLLEQLHALQNQYPAALLVTTTNASMPQLAATCNVHLQAPTGVERGRIATTYGTSDRVAESEEYRTRYDITLAAQVIADLPAGRDSNTEVLDDYIRRRTPSEAVRAGLRCLAQAMNAGVRTALPIAEVMTTLRRCEALATTPSAIDDTLASPLIRVYQARLRFDHEKLARFLTAEHLVLTAHDGAELAQLLTQPAHRDLRDHALMLESDPVRRYDTIRQLADPTLIASAAMGSFGIPTAKQAQADITELLVQAAAAAPHSTFTAKDPQAASLDGTWHHLRQWTPIEESLLLAAGRCAYHGMFLPEIGALMDATDTVMRTAMRDLHGAGSRMAISTVVACTFGPFGQKSTPAAGLVTQGAQDARNFGDRAATTIPTATPTWTPNPRCLGRLYLAALLSHPIRHDIDAQHLPDLVKTGLAVGGYHLRLKLLESAMYGSSVLKSDTRQRMVDVLSGYDNDLGDWGTSSTLIDALASYDQITPVTSLEGIQREIADALSDVDHPDHQTLAQGIVASMFEDERVLGPYSEAIDSLPDNQRLTLYAMSVMPSDCSFGTPWAVKQLAEGADGADDLVVRALARYAGPLPRETFSHSEAVAAHLNGLSGWAKISATLPPVDESADEVAVAWRLVDELLLHLFRGDMVEQAAGIWHRLSHETPGSTVTILRDLYRANSELLSGDQNSTVNPHRALVAAYPDQIRELLQWALTHRDDLPGGREKWHPMGGTSGYAVRMLGVVGTTTTADLLRHHYVHDPELGRDAIEAVHAIDARTQQ